MRMNHSRSVVCAYTDTLHRTRHTVMRAGFVNVTSNVQTRTTELNVSAKNGSLGSSKSARTSRFVAAGAGRSDSCHGFCVNAMA
jgi:hypothetical protein